jgi:hypothetical protein
LVCGKHDWEEEAAMRLEEAIMRKEKIIKKYKLFTNA